jgi:phosphomannomutase
LSGLLISVSGIRGVVGKALTSEVALNYGRAFGMYLRGGKVALGRDTRRTGPMVSSAVIAGLLSSGCDVVDIGICPTPTVELAVRDGGFAGGVAVTASHNPVEYNALKLIGKEGLFLSESQGNKVRDYYKSGRFINSDWRTTGELSSDDRWVNHHIDRIMDLDIISPPLIKERDIKVVADCVGGAACVMAEEFFTRLGVGFRLIHDKPAGTFPRGPEPVPENLSDLSKEVLRYRADVGFAFDPDADRLALVSEKGYPAGEENTLALCARYILSREKGPVAVNLSSSMLNDFVAAEAGVKIHRSKVGERNVTEKMRRTKAVVGGEGNGGLIYPKLHYGRDGFLAAAVITQYLASTKSILSGLVGELPSYVMLKTRLKLPPSAIKRKLAALEKIFGGNKISRLDGIKISGDGWWVQVRASNTEPVVRIMAEAEDDKTARGLIKTVKNTLVK